MSHDDNQQRYDEILQRIANRKPFGRPVEELPKTPYDLILDSLNAYDNYAALSLKSYKDIVCHGPIVIRKSSWSGVMVWHHPKGYYGYRMLTLFGIWVYQQAEEINLTIGTRELPYRASIYNPEGFHASIRKSFKLFYEDDGHPPRDNDTILFQSVYQAKERLTYRQTLHEIIKQWQLGQEPV